jgi:hypothetical protein
MEYDNLSRFEKYFYDKGNWSYYEIQELKTALWVLSVVIIMLGSFIYFSIKQNSHGSETRNYCGPIIEKGKEDPTSGYKSSTDAVYYLIMKDTQCNKTIRVEVNVPTYYNNEIGQNVCFELDRRDMCHYGNGCEHLK